MTEGKILLKNDQIFCEANHLVATMLKDITARTKIKIKHFSFDKRQPTQKSDKPISPCFCGKNWIVATTEGLALPVKIRRNNQFFIPVK